MSHNGGICFATLTTTCCGSPLTAKELVGPRWTRLHRLLKEPMKEQATRGGVSPVEPEGEFVEVIVELLGTHRALIRPQQPPF